VYALTIIDADFSTLIASNEGIANKIYCRTLIQFLMIHKLIVEDNKNIIMKNKCKRYLILIYISINETNF